MLEAIEKGSKWAQQVHGYDRMLWIHQNLEKLRGKDLCCFCSPDKDCHVDVLLELANR